MTWYGGTSTTPTRSARRIPNFNSALIVQGGTIVVTNAQIVQDGGLVRTTKATTYLQNSEYHLTNGVFEGGSVLIGTPVSGREPITHFTGTNVVGPICLATGEREKTEKLVTEK